MSGEYLEKLMASMTVSDCVRAVVGGTALKGLTLTVTGMTVKVRVTAGTVPPLLT